MDMRKRYTSTVLLIGLVAMLFFILDVSVEYWDAFFLTGLAIFMVGGAFLLLEKGVFNFFFYSFKAFLRISSKVEAYVAEVNGEGKSKTPSTERLPFTFYTLFTGMAIIIVTTIIPYYFF